MLTGNKPTFLTCQPINPPFFVECRVVDTFLFCVGMGFMFNLFSNRVGLKKVVEQVVNTQSQGGAMLSEVVSGYESRGGAYQAGSESI